MANYFTCKASLRIAEELQFRTSKLLQIQANPKRQREGWLLLSFRRKLERTVLKKSQWRRTRFGGPGQSSLAAVVGV